MSKKIQSQIKILYMDDTCKIMPDCLILKKYYFPLPTSRSILYSEIEKITLGSSLHFNQKWGIAAHDMNNWFPLDSNRKGKSHYIAFHLKGKKVIPSFTPIDAPKVFDILLHNSQKHGFGIVFQDLASIENQNNNQYACEKEQPYISNDKQILLQGGQSSIIA